MSSTLDLSVIIPFKGKVDMTLTCVRSLLENGPPVREVVLVDNRSSTEEVGRVREGIASLPGVRLVHYPHPFNYQKLCNWGVGQTEGEFVFFLNNDTELTSESRGVVEHMYQRAGDPATGAVGCLLLYGDRRTIQHAGVYLRPGLLGEHLYVGLQLRKVLARAGTVPFPYDVREDRPVSAVTGAAQVIERRKFLAVGGMDERFIVCGGDVDLCLRLNAAELQTWYVWGGGHIVHKESQSRRHQPIPYTDFTHSYRSYMTAFDLERGDPFLHLAQQPREAGA